MAQNLLAFSFTPFCQRWQIFWQEMHEKPARPKSIAFGERRSPALNFLLPNVFI